MQAFESLQKLLKTIGACSYVSSPDSLPGTTRHVLQFASDHGNSAIPCLDDSAEFALRYNEARVDWQIQGALFGAPANTQDPVVFFVQSQVEAERRVAELNCMLAALRVTLKRGVKSDFVEWLRDFQRHAPGQTFALRNEHGQIVGGEWESPQAKLKVYFSSVGLWEHRMGWFMESGTHIWPISTDSMEALERRCRDYIRDTAWVVEEAVRILRKQDLV